ADAIAPRTVVRAVHAQRGQLVERVALVDGDLGATTAAVARLAPRLTLYLALDEALHQALVQRVAQPVLDRARALAKVPGVLDPAAAVAHVGPGADERDPAHED